MKTSYELFREIKQGGEATVELSGDVYTLTFFGDRTDAFNGLLAVRRSDGSTQRFRYGYSSESVANFITTLERRRWNDPVRPWLNPEKWEEPPLTEWEKSGRGYGEINHQQWMCWDGFVSHIGGCGNHNRAKGAPKEQRINLTEEEWDVLQALPVKERLQSLIELRGAQCFREIL